MNPKSETSIIYFIEIYGNPSEKKTALTDKIL